MTEEEQIIALKKIIKAYEIFIPEYATFHSYKEGFIEKPHQKVIDKFEYYQELIWYMRTSLMYPFGTDYFEEEN